MIGSRDGALAFEGRRKYALGTRRGDEMCEFLLMALVSSEGLRCLLRSGRGLGWPWLGPGVVRET